MGSCLQTDPAELCFERGVYGKPRLFNPRVRDIRFNLSHSAGLAVYAVAVGREVGVDVEQIRPDFPVRDVVDRVFTLLEREALDEVTIDQRVEAFFDLWTKKEAFLKGIGAGLVHAGHNESATVLPKAAGGRNVAAAAMLETRKGWSLASFHASFGYAAAVAVEGHGVGTCKIAHELSLRVVTVDRG